MKIKAATKTILQWLTPAVVQIACQLRAGICWAVLAGVGLLRGLS